MNQPVIIIGAGVGGLCAAIRLAGLGYNVRVLEARNRAGGLASGLDLEGFPFDSGPYILLDKPGLDWAFGQLQIDPGELSLHLIEHIYHVLHENGSQSAFERDLAVTAGDFDKYYPGKGELYKNFVNRTFRVHQDLKPLTFRTHPSATDMMNPGRIGHIPFMFRSLGSVLDRSGMPETIQEGISIWTHIAGQPVSVAPSPMAFVPGLFHHVGSYYPQGGMRAIAELLTRKALAAGVQIDFGTKVTLIRVGNNRVSGVETDLGEQISTSHVLSNSAGIGTYTELLEGFPYSKKASFLNLPLQSPGVCIYLAVKGRNPPYYIRFKLKGKTCVAFVQPGLMDPGLEREGWFPARMIAPLDHESASAMGAGDQDKLMDAMLGDSWWQAGISAYRVLHRRTTYAWGQEFNLYRDSMNPVMTSRFMLKGRIAHRSPFVKGLYLAGSSTHPGQWVSFCAISGVLAADCLHKDMHHA